MKSNMAYWLYMQRSWWEVKVLAFNIRGRSLITRRGGGVCKPGGGGGDKFLPQKKGEGQTKF